MPELHDLADSLAVLDHDAVGRQDLIFRIEQKLLDQAEALVGEGVLEVTTGPEGYVMIRNLDAANPVTEPVNRATVVRASNYNTFRDTFSSVKFMNP